MLTLLLTAYCYTTSGHTLKKDIQPSFLTKKRIQIKESTRTDERKAKRQLQAKQFEFMGPTSIIQIKIHTNGFSADDKEVISFSAEF